MQDRRIIIVRHSRTIWHGSGKFIGQADIPLSTYGIECAKNLSEIIAKFQPNYLISSDLKRAQSTAIIIANRCNIPIKIDARLREENLGKWSGHTHAEVEKKYPNEYHRWYKGDIYSQIGEREGLIAVELRASLALKEILKKSTGDIVIVTHLNTAIALIAGATGLPIEEWYRIDDIEPCEFSVLRKQNSKWILDKD